MSSVCSFPFNPLPNSTQTITVTTTAQDVTLPALNQVEINAVGSEVDVIIAFGQTVVETTGYHVPAGSIAHLSSAKCQTLSLMLPADSDEQTVYITPGNGS